MSETYPLSMIELSELGWSYSYSHGYTWELVRRFLRNEMTRESFTAWFARADMAHTAYTEALNSGHTAHEAIRIAFPTDPDAASTP